MGESEAASTKVDLEALRALQADALKLERLEYLLDQFNVFETTGFIGQELMHSRSLAFLLDPKQNHGIEDVLLMKILKTASVISNTVSVLKVLEDINSRDTEQTAVQTEAYTDDGRIALLLLNEIEEWAMIVENKIWPPNTPTTGQILPIREEDSSQLAGLQDLSDPFW
jgi:hypothetical protein